MDTDDQYCASPLQVSSFRGHEWIDVHYGPKVTHATVASVRRSMMTTYNKFAVTEVEFEDASLADLLDHVALNLQTMGIAYDGGRSEPPQYMVDDEYSAKMSFSVSYEKAAVKFRVSDGRAIAITTDNLAHFCSAVVASSKPCRTVVDDDACPTSPFQAYWTNALSLVGCGATLFTLYKRDEHVTFSCTVACKPACHHGNHDPTSGVSVRSVPKITFDSNRVHAEHAPFLQDRTHVRKLASGLALACRHVGAISLRANVQDWSVIADLLDIDDTRCVNCGACASFESRTGILVDATSVPKVAIHVETDGSLHPQQLLTQTCNRLREDVARLKDAVIKCDNSSIVTM